ncbi:MAG: hypothetical protein K2X98_05750 [Alphaproteobacteria bacterium]|nr:hypothetical protein [Alphaproteobacteria bacterium]
MSSVTKADVHTGFQAVQGHPINGSALFRGVAQQTAVGTIGGVCANRIGAAALDSLTDKLLHGILGGGTGYILNGVEGMKAGAMAAVIAETMADF